MTNEQMNAEAVRRWPYLPMKTAKQRHRARSRVKRAIKVEALVSAGHSCATCVFHTALPSSLVVTGKYTGKTCCDLRSGGGAYQMTSPDYVCMYHQARKAK